MIECDITKKVHNIHLTISEIEKFPQTYKSLLRHQKNNKTLGFILRRKINNLIKLGLIYKTSIPGTRFGKAIFYSENKKYHILVEGDRFGSNVYCFFNYKKNGKYYIIVDVCWKLIKGNWEQIGKKILFEGNVLKWV